MFWSLTFELLFLCLESLHIKWISKNFDCKIKNRRFFTLRSSWSSETKTCDMTLIFLMSVRYSIELMKIVWYKGGGALCMCNAFWRWNLDFTMKIWLCHEISHTGRPLIRPTTLYHVIFTISMIYLTDIKKIRFISYVLTSDGCAERKDKNHRFLSFRRNFGIPDTSSRCSKLLKIA